MAVAAHVLGYRVAPAAVALALLACPILITGCSRDRPTAADQADESARQVTLHVPEMAERLDLF